MSLSIESERTFHPRTGRASRTSATRALVGGLLVAVASSASGFAQDVEGKVVAAADKPAGSVAAVLQDEPGPRPLSTRRQVRVVYPSPYGRNATCEPTSGARPEIAPTC